MNFTDKDKQDETQMCPEIDMKICLYAALGGVEGDAAKVVVLQSHVKYLHETDVQMHRHVAVTRSNERTPVVSTVCT